MQTQFCLPKPKSLTNHGQLPVFFTILAEWFEITILAVVLGGVVIGLTQDPEANIMRFFGTQLSLRIMTFAFLIGTAPLLMFFTSPMYRAISLKYGRKPVLIFSSFGSVLASVLLALGVQFSAWWSFGIYLVFVARFLKGTLSANNALAMGILGDISKKQEKGGILGYHLFQCAAFLGGVGGAVVGMLIPRWAGMVNAFWFIAIVQGVVFIWNFFSEETLAKGDRVKHTEGFLPLKALAILKEGFCKGGPAIRAALIGIFLYDVAWNYYVYYMQIYVLQKFNLQDPIFFIGLIWLAGMGVFLLTRIFVLPTLARLQVSPVKAFKLGGYVSGGLLLAAAFADKAQPTFFVLSILAYIGFCLTSSVTRVAMMAKVTKGDHTAYAMGCIWLMWLVSIVVASIFAGWMQNTYLELPFILLGGLMILSSLFFYAKRRLFSSSK